MSASESVPWPRLRDYLLHVSTCRTLDECMRTACIEMQTVIPFDATAGIFRMADGVNVAGVGKPGCTEAYNSYYRKCRPHVEVPLIDWRKHEVEYAADFCRPNGMYKAVRCEVPGHQSWLSVVRSRRAPDFSESDADTLALIEDFLNILFGSLGKLAALPALHLSTEGIADRYSALSPREAEVCALVSARLSTAEIAARLFISPRTVERHVEDIFEKLDVRSREQLRYRLGVLPF